MSYVKSKSNILATRDEREELLQSELKVGRPATVFVSLAIPGEQKNRPGTAELFEWAWGSLGRTLPLPEPRCLGRDALGPFAVMQACTEPREVKRLCIRIETQRPAARLVDLDVYDSSGNPVDRASLGLPPRRCLVCDQPAADCQRLQRHSPEKILEAVDGLLAHIRD